MVNTRLLALDLERHVNRSEITRIGLYSPPDRGVYFTGDGAWVQEGNFDGSPATG